MHRAGQGSAHCKAAESARTRPLRTNQPGLAASFPGCCFSSGRLPSLTTHGSCSLGKGSALPARRNRLPRSSTTTSMLAGCLLRLRCARQGVQCAWRQDQLHSSSGQRKPIPKNSNRKQRWLMCAQAASMIASKLKAAEACWRQQRWRERRLEQQWDTDSPNGLHLRCRPVYFTPR